MKTTLIGLLAAQNPWWASPEQRAAGAYRERRSEFGLLRRQFMDVEAPQVLLIGPRQAGKTVLLWQILDSLLDERAEGQQLWDPRQIVYFNFDDERLPFRRPTLRAIVEAHDEAFPDLRSRQVVFLLDEVGRSPDWGVSLKHLHSESSARGATRRFLVTDSASMMLDARGRVAGRFTRHRLPFLGFADFVRIRSDLPFDVVAGTEFDAYLERGGSPAHLRVDDASVARHHIREATMRSVMLDLTTTGRIRQPDKAAALFAALAADSGTILNASARGDDVGVGRETVDKWLGVLVETGLLRRLDAASRSARSRARLQPRIFCADPGMAGAFAMSSRPMEEADSRGRIVETAALVHLEAVAERFQGRLGYGASPAECDFILELKGTTVAIQVTAGRNANRADAEKAARAASHVPRAFGTVLSRHPAAVRHVTTQGVVKEVPLWSFCRAATELGTAEELLAWFK